MTGGLLESGGVCVMRMSCLRDVHEPILLCYTMSSHGSGFGAGELVEGGVGARRRSGAGMSTRAASLLGRVRTSRGSSEWNKDW